MCHFFKVESPFWLKSGGSGALTMFFCEFTHHYRQVLDDCDEY